MYMENQITYSIHMTSICKKVPLLPFVFIHTYLLVNTKLTFYINISGAKIWRPYRSLIMLYFVLWRWQLYFSARNKYTYLGVCRYICFINPCQHICMSNILYTSFAHCSSFEGNKYYMNTKIFSKEMLKR